jgi:hypothetical protein
MSGAEFARWSHVESLLRSLVHSSFLRFCSVSRVATKPLVFSDAWASVKCCLAVVRRFVRSCSVILTNIIWLVNVRALVPSTCLLQAGYRPEETLRMRRLCSQQESLCSRTIVPMTDIVRYQGGQRKSGKCFGFIVLTACSPKLDTEIPRLHCKGLRVWDLHSSGSWLPIFRRSHLQGSGSRRMTALPLKMVPVGCPETSVTN